MISWLKFINGNRMDTVTQTVYLVIRMTTLWAATRSLGRDTIMDGIKGIQIHTMLLVCA